MTIYEMIQAFMNEVTKGTINGICLGFWIILIGETWKWFWGVTKRFLTDMFPGLHKEDKE